MRLRIPPLAAELRQNLITLPHENALLLFFGTKTPIVRRAILNACFKFRFVSFSSNVHHMDGRFKNLAGTNALSSSRHISLKSRKGSSAPLSIMARTSGRVLFGKK